VGRDGVIVDPWRISQVVLFKLFARTAERREGRPHRGECWTPKGVNILGAETQPISDMQLARAISEFTSLTRNEASIATLERRLNPQY
jgi:hypothetical protein